MFKKKQAMKRGGVTKKRGGGMMGPKKKMAKGGAVAKARARKPYGRLNKDDIARAMASAPKGRDSAARNAAMKGVKTKAGTMMAKIKQGSGNVAGRDTSLQGRIMALLKKGRSKPKAKSMEMGPGRKSLKGKMKGLGALGKTARRKAAGKKK